MQYSPIGKNVDNFFHYGATGWTDWGTVSYEEQKLFLEPNIKVKKGDRITITQGTGQKHVLFSKKPFYYPSHIEVVLSGSSIDE